MSLIKLRSVVEKDKIILYNWFNNDNLNFKIKTKKKISIKNHFQWFNDFIKFNRGNIWIIQQNDKDIGNIRLNRIKEKKYEIDIFIIKEFRRNNIGSASIKEVEKKIDEGTVIYSLVKKNNIRSKKFFLKNKYLLYQSTREFWILHKTI